MPPYASNGSLWRVVWDRWKRDAQGNFTNYEILTTPKPREYYYDGAGARYMAMEMNVGIVTFQDEEWFAWAISDIPAPMTRQDSLGLLPFNDGLVALVDEAPPGEPDGQRETAVVTEQTRYLSAGLLRASADAAENATAEQYFHRDLTGSAMLITNEAGAVVNRLRYTAFGETIQADNSVGGNIPSSAGRYGYCGGYGYESGLITLDGSPESGLPSIVLQHIGARWYEPALGRFVQRDPIGLGGGINAYSYVCNSPLAGIDPSGESLALGLSGHSLYVHTMIRIVTGAIVADHLLLRMFQNYFQYQDVINAFLWATEVFYDQNTGRLIIKDEKVMLVYDDKSKKLITCMPAGWFKPSSRFVPIFRR